MPIKIDKLSSRPSSLTREHIKNEVSKTVGLSPAMSAALVDQIITHITLALTKGEDVKLASFGTFKLRTKVERIGRNPKTNEEVIIPSRRVVTFKPSEIMKERVANPRIKSKVKRKVAAKSLQIPMRTAGLTQDRSLEQDNTPKLHISRTHKFNS